MKLYSLQVLYKSETSDQATPLIVAHDLNSFGFFEKKAVKEFMDFTGKLIVERSQRCNRSKVREQAYICHCYIRGDYLAGICISDDEYPDRVAQTLLNNVRLFYLN
uniref:Longin domain-containing protein n=1 Tax=Macrostomum lignano TaxID=282301 RepID=A0A1I8IR96_9PLAT